MAGGDERVSHHPGNWIKVVFAYECDEQGNCPNCGIDYADCPCPGPCQDDLYEYIEVDGGLFAMRLDLAEEGEKP